MTIPSNDIFPIDPITIWHVDLPSSNFLCDLDEPTLTPYNTKSKCNVLRPVIIICPGGSYRSHAEHEGKGYAEWLTQHGVVCFVLKYRLGIDGPCHPAPLEDLERSVRIIRKNATVWKLDTKRVGVMGSSAGGHLASLLLTQFSSDKIDALDPVNRESSRPDIGVLCYPLISMQENIHEASKLNLAGHSPASSLIQLLSSDLHVSANTPPCFIWHTFEDTSVKVEHSLAFAKSLSHANVPFELHIYETGRHGMGLETVHPWGDACIKWLKARGFIELLPDSNTAPT